MKQKISITINDKLLRNIDSLIDNIFIRNRSMAIEYYINQALKESKVAVILAGDSSKAILDKLNKRFELKIDHQTVIEKATRKLSDSGFKTIYVIADKKNISHIFNIIGDGSRFGVKINFIIEETPLGTASALKLLKGIVKTTFLVVQCDLIFDKYNLNELWRQHIEDKMVATLIVSSSLTSTNKTPFGMVHLEGRRITSFVESPLPKNYGSSIFFGGVFVSEPEIFSYSGKSLEYDIFPELVKRKLLGGQLTSAEHLHIHSHEDLINVRSRFKDILN